MGSSKIGQSLTAREIQQLVETDLKKVEEEIRLESVASVNAITSIGQYLHASGGKRLRPTLLLLSCRLFGEPSAGAIRLAAVVEMIHTATLVHDDVIDIAETRRGRPSTGCKRILKGTRRSKKRWRRRRPSPAPAWTWRPATRGSTR